MNSIPLPALQDNDLWVLHDGYPALAMRPGDAQPVLDCSQRDGLQLGAILVTHQCLDDKGDADAPRDAAGRRPGRLDCALGNRGFTDSPEPVKLELIH
jgi:hydroxyacylglutathione hydrolase